MKLTIRRKGSVFSQRRLVLNAHVSKVSNFFMVKFAEISINIMDFVGGICFLSQSSHSNGSIN